MGVIVVQKTTVQSAARIAVLELMEAEGISRAELARRMRVKRPAITQMLAPGRGWTLDMLQQIVEAIGGRIRLEI